MNITRAEDMLTVIVRTTVVVVAVIALILLYVDLRFFYVEVLLGLAYVLKQQQNKQRLNEQNYESLFDIGLSCFNQLLLTSLVYLNTAAIVGLLIWIAN